MWSSFSRVCLALKCTSNNDKQKTYESVDSVYIPHNIWKCNSTQLYMKGVGSICVYCQISNSANMWGMSWHW